MKRGEIYYINIPFYTGSEMAKARPGVIVSCDALNRSSPVVTVVYLTATPKHWSPGHVFVDSAPRPSTALCEQIYTVDKSRLTDCLGMVTECELAEIDAAISRTLNLSCKAEDDEEVESDTAQESDSLRAELAIYKHLYAELLDRLTKTA